MTSCSVVTTNVAEEPAAFLVKGEHKLQWEMGTLCRKGGMGHEQEH